jgi:hypothetical protein
MKPCDVHRAERRRTVRWLARLLFRELSAASCQLHGVSLGALRSDRRGSGRAAGQKGLDGWKPMLGKWKFSNRRHIAAIGEASNNGRALARRSRAIRLTLHQRSK